MSDDKGGENRMPEVLLVVAADGKKHIEGFERFDEWAVRNLRTYGQVSEGMTLSGLGETDRLKMLVMRLSEKVLDLAGRCVRVGKLSGAGLQITQLGKIESDKGHYDVGLFNGVPCVYSRQSRTMVLIPLEELWRQAVLCRVDDPMPPQAPRILAPR